MSFTFNFPAPDAEASILDADEAHSKPAEKPAEAMIDLPLAPFKEHSLSSAVHDSEWNTITVGDTTLQFVCPQWLETTGEGSAGPLSNLFGSQKNVDIVPRVYEGGFRVWDGACDMLSYLSTEPDLVFQGKKILELGCGAGLPAIYALINGAIVHFHDYNSEVIELATIPNIQKNLKKTKMEENSSFFGERVKLFSGDWTEFIRHLNVENKGNQADDFRYDIILTSDTVYRQDVLFKLCAAFPKLLRKNGFALVAGKSHYFGLDGGLDVFREELQKQNLFTVESSKEYPDCVRREVLTVKWKNQP